MAVLLAAVLNLLSSDARQDLARAYARQFALKLESDCPAAFGNAFWFSCAGEVRRINPSAAPLETLANTGPLRAGVVISGPPASQPAPAVKPVSVRQAN